MPVVFATSPSVERWRSWRSVASASVSPHQILQVSARRFRANSHAPFQRQHPNSGTALDL